MCFCLGLFMGNKSCCCNQSNYNNSIKCPKCNSNNDEQDISTFICKCKVCGQKSSNNSQIKKIYQPAYCPLICPKNFDNYSSDFWENGFNY